MSLARRILPLFIPHLGCGHNCVFCSQRSISGHTEPVTPASVAEALASLSRPVDELAFYGGSFTALPLSAQEGYLSAAAPFLQKGVIRAIRVSTRPDAVSVPALEQLRRYGAETVELGAQSMDDAVLRVSGRGHSAEDTAQAAARLRRFGFRVILQMMTGLPGSSPERDFRTGEALAALRPDGVRIYPTVILRDTPLYDLWRRGEYREHTVSDAVEICARLLPLFESKGIPVIRLGLNPTDALSAGQAAGGAYDPALGEKVRSRIYLEKARALLRRGGYGACAVLGVCKSDVSQLIGQHRCNLEALRTEFHLERLSVRPAELPRGEVALLEAKGTAREDRSDRNTRPLP